MHEGFLLEIMENEKTKQIVRPRDCDIRERRFESLVGDRCGKSLYFTKVTGKSASLENSFRWRLL